MRFGDQIKRAEQSLRRRIPSIQSLLALELVARQENLSLSAEELSLTESAFSRQNSGLEAQIHVKLFERIRGRMRLNEEGAAYASKVSQLIDDLERCTLDHRADRVEKYSSNWRNTDVRR